MDNIKDTNPKDIVGQTKCPLDVVPDTISVEAAPAFLEGALKYGRYNWRVSGVRASVYKSALERHIKKWWNGENYDEDTHVKHLANAIACLGIILDAELCGKLEDDRPPKAPLSSLINQQTTLVEHLKIIFKDATPKHYTIHD